MDSSTMRTLLARVEHHMDDADDASLLLLLEGMIDMLARHELMIFGKGTTEGLTMTVDETMSMLRKLESK